LHPTIAFQNIRVLLPAEALEFLNLNHNPPDAPLKFMERLGERGTGTVLNTGDAPTSGVPVAEILPLSAFYFEFVDRELEG
jgi:hypothetical protein